MTRRLLILSTDFGIPVWGSKGASVHLRAMVRAFSNMGLSVALAARRIGSPEPGRDHLPARLFSLPSGPRPSDPGFSPAALNTSLGARLEEIAAQFPFEAIYERSALWTTAGLEHSLARDQPHLVEVNAPLALESARWRELPFAAEARAAETRLATEATRLFPVSRPLADFLVALGAHRPRIVVLPNAVDHAFVAAGVERLAGRNRPRSGPSAFTIGFVGSLKPWHGIETLLEAVRRLGALGRGYKLRVVGNGPLADALKNAAFDAGTIEHVGAVPHESVPALLSGMDVAVAPYLETGEGYFSPLKIIEYQAAGVPVVASGGHGVAALVEDGRTGLMVPAGDDAALATAIERLRNDPALSRRLAARAHVVAAGHTWQRNAERVIREWATGPDIASRFPEGVGP